MLLRAIAAAGCLLLALIAGFLHITFQEFKATHIAHVQDLTQTHSASIKDLKATHATEIANLRAAQSEAAATHVAAMANLRAAQSEAAATHNATIAARDAAHVAAVSELTAAHAQTLRALEASHEAALAALASAHAAAAIEAKAAHVAAVADVEQSHAVIVAALDDVNVEQLTRIADLQTQLAAAEARCQQHFELVVPPSFRFGPARQFLVPYRDPFPPPLPRNAHSLLDPEWYAQSTAGTGFAFDVNVPHYDRLNCTAHGDPDAMQDNVTASVLLRMVAPLPLPSSDPSGIDPSSTADGHDDVLQPLPTCRFIIDAYAPLTRGARYWRLYLGLISSATNASSSSTTGAAGYSIGIVPRGNGTVSAAWSALPRCNTTRPQPSTECESGCTAKAGPDNTGAGVAVDTDCSSYATATVPPPMPAGSAVGFSADYARNTVRVDYFSPEAVGAGFRGAAGAPHAVMEMQLHAPVAPASLHAVIDVYRRGLVVRMVS